MQAFKMALPLAQFALADKNFRGLDGVKDPRYVGLANKIQYNQESVRQNQTWTGMVAEFVDSDDIIPFQLLYSLQQKKPWKNFGGYNLTNIVTSDELMVWIDVNFKNAIVCFVGQNIATNSQHLVDDLNVAGLTSNQSCQLRLARVGETILQQISHIPNITLCGYSLGGSVVQCLCTNATVTRGIVFNGGAPITNQPRTVPENCTVYHIVGDLLSTHYTECERIYLFETNAFREQTENVLQTDGIQWIDVAYYHSLDRFLDMKAPWRFVNSQFEQNSLENYFFYKNGELADLALAAAGLLSVEFNIKRKLQILICSNPIPGAQTSRGCSESKPTDADRLLGKVAGGVVGAVTSGVETGGAGVIPGAIAGAAAGEALITGEKGILDIINPEIGKNVSAFGQKLIQGASYLDRYNNDPGRFTGTIVDKGNTNVFGGTEGIVARPSLQ